MVLLVSAASCGSAVEVPVSGEASSSSDTTSEPGFSASGDAATTSGVVGSTSVESTTVGSSGDDGPRVLPQRCDAYAQDCPAGYTCTPYSTDGGSDWNDTICVLVPDDPAGFGEPCMFENSTTSGLDSCGFGAMCFWTGPGPLEGECVELCGGSEQAPTCQQSDAYCAISAAGVFNGCLPSCDPLADTCGAGEACYPVRNFFSCAPDFSGRGGALGETCSFTNACDGGLGCVNPVPGVCDPGAPRCCLPYCSLADADCPAGLTCLAFFDPADVLEAYEDVGICGPPE